MSVLYAESLTLTSTAKTADDTSAEFVAPREHDSLLVECGIYTLNSSSGVVTPTLLFCPTAGGTYTVLWEGDPLSDTTAAPTRGHLTDLTYVLPGFYKLAHIVTSGTPNFTLTSKLYAGRRAAKL